MEKIPVGILGATGTVGQKFVALLANHPQFKIHELVASSRSADRPYCEACRWMQSQPIPQQLGDQTVRAAGEPLESRLLFSGMDSSVAGPLEQYYAGEGALVISNSKNHRMDSNVPLVIPEINSDHLQLLSRQPYRGGIITNSNCSTMFLAMVLAPLHRRFGVDRVLVSTMQAISGAGYPGVPSMDIMGNVIPFIADEEEKMEQEAAKILGTMNNGSIVPATFKVSAQCNRVAVSDGHTETISIGFTDGISPAPDEIAETLRDFTGPPQEWQLPSAPQHPIVVCQSPDRPQPLRDLWLQNGMAAVVGRIRPCPVLDIKMVVLGHNTIRGAAGAAVLNAEAAQHLGLLS